PPLFSTLSLHDALPISDGPSGGPDTWKVSGPKRRCRSGDGFQERSPIVGGLGSGGPQIVSSPKGAAGYAEPGGSRGIDGNNAFQDRKSTRLNSSHVKTS